ncbi:hypothetical protein Tco_0876217 [Tanacetum coccineum]|uniref:Uncharacterized protein n=1 Tax=Tanacetum coccineum TaxID=301880 RepID=A0ABQ5BRP0_9ASTR
MCTRSSSSNLVHSSTNPKSIIRNQRRNLGDPSLLLDFEEINMDNNNNNVQGPPRVGPNFQGPIPDLRSMEELLQAPTDGVGDAIVVPLILANQFELKIGLLNLVTAIAFHGFENDDPHSHIRRITKITQIVKLNNVPSDDSLNSAANGNFLTKNTQEALTIIENKSKVEALVSSMNRPIILIQNGCETYGGPHAYYECQAAGGYTQEDVYATTRTYNAGGNSYQPQGYWNVSWKKTKEYTKI